MNNQAGPSRTRPQSATEVEPREDVDDPRPRTAPVGQAGPSQGEEGDEDEERMDFKAIESIARYATLY
jgi:hypothetical protein